MKPYLRVALTLLPLVGGVGLATAQTPTLPDRPAPPPANDRAHSPGSLPDQNAKQEPTAKTNSDTQTPGVFVNGRLNVEGAAQNTETTPAKFSPENDARDKIPIMAHGPALTEEQKQRIAETVKQARVTSANLNVKPPAELPPDVELRDWPPAVASAIPSVSGMKYVVAGDKILIVEPNNRIVVSEIPR